MMLGARPKRAPPLFSFSIRRCMNHRRNCLFVTWWIRAPSTRSNLDATAGPASENLINSEVEILTSSDLAIQVAKVVGVERLMELSNGAADVAKAARNVRLGPERECP